MKKLFILLIVTLAIGCSEDIYPTGSSLIGKGSLFGNGSEGISKQNMVISDESSWHVLLEKLNSVNNVSESFTETTIDFSAYQLIAVFDEIRSTGGYSIDLDILESSDKIQVNISYQIPEDLATTVITQPFHIVKIPLTSRAIEFN